VSDDTLPNGKSLLAIDAAVFSDVKVVLKARLGEVSLTIQELLALKSGSIIKLGLKLNEPIELSLNDAVVARGEIVAVDDSFGVRILERAALV